MKKIYISVPMRGRTEEAIKESFEKMSECAVILLGDDVTVVNEYTGKKTDNDPNIPMNRSIQMLGESISLMSLADYVVCVDDWWGYQGCAVEHCVRQEYNIPHIGLAAKYVCPDIFKTPADKVVLYAEGKEFTTVNSNDA